MLPGYNPFYVAALEHLMRLNASATDIAMAASNAVIDVTEHVFNYSDEAVKRMQYNAAKQWVLDECNKIMQTFDDPVTAAEKVADFLDKMGSEENTLYAGIMPVPYSLLSPYITNTLAERNGQLLVRNEADALCAWEENIADLFPADDKSQWRPLILTTNTTSALSEHDLTVVMDGAEGFYRLTHAKAGKENIKEPRVVSTLHTKKTMPENGAALFRRWGRLFRGQRTMVNITPDAVQLGNLILACLAEKPEAINVAASPEKITESFTELPSILAPGFEDSDIVLREDAAEIAAHIKLFGYSRAGSIVTDALRYVGYKLQAPREKNGSDHQADTILVHDKDSGSTRAIERSDIIPILSAMPVFSVAAQSFPLNKREQRMGMRRINLKNKNDEMVNYVVGQFRSDSMVDNIPKYNGSDILVEVGGPTENLGHDPDMALPDTLGEKTGYLWFSDEENPRRIERVQQILCMFFSNELGYGNSMIDTLSRAFEAENAAYIAK